MEDPTFTTRLPIWCLNSNLFVASTPYKVSQTMSPPILLSAALPKFVEFLSPIQATATSKWTQATRITWKIGTFRWT